MKTLKDLMGRHVVWTKLEGKTNPSMTQKQGFGSLYQLEVGRMMRIEGDGGLCTSLVKAIEEVDGGIRVTTHNSAYFLEEAK